MSNMFLKNFHLCFFGLYNSSQPHAPQSQHDAPPQPASSLIKRFSTLYDLTSESTSKSFTFSSSSDLMISSSDDSSDTESTQPDFATVFASQRFFFSSPGLSNSIIESSPENNRSPRAVSGGVAVPTYSPDPVADFRRSMQEMIEARHCDNNDGNGGSTSDFEYLHELLSCYLRLNSEQNHKYIITAFTDILAGPLSECRKPPQSRRRLVL